MNKLTIAIGSNNGINISAAHAGDSKCFFIYQVLENGEDIFIEKRVNTASTEDESHGATEKLNAVTNIIKDCDIIIARKMSPNFKRIAINTKFQPVVVNLDDIKEIVNIIADSFDELFYLVKLRKNNVRTEEIPVLD